MPRGSNETLAPPGDVEKAAALVSKQEAPVDDDVRQKQEPSENVPSSDQEFLVFLDEDESPKSLSLARKCIIVAVVSMGALCSTFASSVVRAHRYLRAFMSYAHSGFCRLRSLSQARHGRSMSLRR